MEDILSSIKRIIAEEGEATPGRGRRAGRAAPPMPSDDEVLELSNPMPQPASSHARTQQQRPADAIRAEPVAPPVDRAPPTEVPARAEPVAVADPVEAERQPERATRTAPARAPDAAAVEAPADAPMVSSGTVEATRGALDQLSRLLVKPEPRTDGTLEGLVREMLRPMLRDWLDAQLPALVEEMVAREIEKIISARR